MREKRTLSGSRRILCGAFFICFYNPSAMFGFLLVALALFSLVLLREHALSIGLFTNGLLCGCQKFMDPLCRTRTFSGTVIKIESIEDEFTGDLFNCRAYE